MGVPATPSKYECPKCKGTSWDVFEHAVTCTSCGTTLEVTISAPKETKQDETPLAGCVELPETAPVGTAATGAGN